MSDLALILDKMAQRYHQRPSEIIEVEDAVLALDFDLAVMLRGVKQETDQMQKSRKGTQHHSPAESMRYLQGKFGNA